MNRINRKHSQEPNLSSVLRSVWALFSQDCPFSVGVSLCTSSRPYMSYSPSLLNATATSKRNSSCFRKWLLLNVNMVPNFKNGNLVSNTQDALL